MVHLLAAFLLAVSVAIEARGIFDSDLADTLVADDVEGLGLLQVNADALGAGASAAEAHHANANDPILAEATSLAEIGGNELLNGTEEVRTVETIPDLHFGAEGDDGMPGAYVRGSAVNDNVLYGGKASSDADAALDLAQIAQKQWHFFVNGFKQLALNNAHSDLCGVSWRGSIVCRAARFGWYDLPAIPGEPTFVAMNDNHLIALNKKGNAFRWRLRLNKRRGWRRVTSKDTANRIVSLKQIAVNNQDRLCGVSRKRQLYCKHGYGSRWAKVPVYNGWPSFVSMNERDLFVSTNDPYNRHRFVMFKRLDTGSLARRGGWRRVKQAESLSQITVNNKPSVDTHLLCGKSTNGLFRCTDTWDTSGKATKWYNVGGNYKPKYIASNDLYMIVVTNLGHVFIKAV